MDEKASILIVDDNLSLCKTMTLILRRKGYDATSAKDGYEAIVKVKEGSFDLIFMDIKMPLMDGVETYKEIKKIRPDSVVIMMTAYAVEDLIQEALKEGAYGVLYKPLDMEKIFSFIKTAKEAKHGGLILIVDDDPGFTTTLKNILSKRGYSVAVAQTGEAAISKVQGDNFCLILIDLKLPTINGLETYLAIKKIKPEIMAIMITGYRQEMADLIQDALNNSAYTCLYKPLDIEFLLNLIDKILKVK
jgi:DNA-binding NtrC family response regulator